MVSWGSGPGGALKTACPWLALPIGEPRVTVGVVALGTSA